MDRAAIRPHSLWRTFSAAVGPVKLQFLHRLPDRRQVGARRQHAGPHPRDPRCPAGRAGPITTKELKRGLNTADALLQLFTRRTGALLRWQRKRGVLRSVKDPQHGRFDLWEIAV